MSTIHISFKLEHPLIIPVYYQHLLQAFIYSILPEEESAYLHNKGYKHNNRNFKLFCFSNIQCENSFYDRNSNKITFNNEIKISISSVLPNLIEKTINNLMLNVDYKINGQKIMVTNIEFDKNIVSTNVLNVKALSPITAYSTYQKRNGSSMTHYFSPEDRVFKHLIQENFAKKYETFTGKSLESENELLTIKPLHVTCKNKIVTNYKGIWITGWTGAYQLKAKPEYLSFILDCGISSKNSAGFGFIVQEPISIVN